MVLFLTDTENLWGFPFLKTTDDFRLLLTWTYPGYSKPLECLHQENSCALFFLFLEIITNYKFCAFSVFWFLSRTFLSFFFKFNDEKLTYLSKKIWNSKIWFFLSSNKYVIIHNLSIHLFFYQLSFEVLK